MIDKQTFIQQIEAKVTPELQKYKKKHLSALIALYCICIPLALLILTSSTLSKSSDSIVYLLLIPGALCGLYFKKNIKRNLSPFIYRQLNLIQLSDSVWHNSNRSFIQKMTDDMDQPPDGASARAALPTTKSLEQEGLLPNYTRISVDDFFQVNEAPLPLYMRETNAEKQSLFEKHPHTVFHGPIVFIKQESKNYRFTLLQASSANYKGDPPKNLQKILLEDPDFQKEYQVYSEDQIQARVILSPAFMERLKRIRDVYHAPVHVLFKNNLVILAINTGKDMFEFVQSHFFIPKYDLSNFEKFYDEIKALTDFIEVLKLK